MGQRFPAPSPLDEVASTTNDAALSHEYRMKRGSSEGQVCGVGSAKLDARVEAPNAEQHLFGAGQIGRSLRQLREELGRRDLFRRDSVLLSDATLRDPEGVV